MRGITRSVGGVLIALMVLACDNWIFNGDAMDDVEFSAEVRQAEKLVVLTVENRRSDTVYYHSAWLERREDGDWKRFEPPGTATIQNLLVHPIEPGEDHVVEREIKPDYEPLTLAPGEYRFRVSMSPDGAGNIPSKDAEASNAFRIEP